MGEAAKSESSKRLPGSRFHSKQFHVGKMIGKYVERNPKEELQIEDGLMLL